MYKISVRSSGVHLVCGIERQGLDLLRLGKFGSVSPTSLVEADGRFC